MFLCMSKRIHSLFVGFLLPSRVSPSPLQWTPFWSHVNLTNQSYWGPALMEHVFHQRKLLQMLCGSKMPRHAAASGVKWDCWTGQVQYKGWGKLNGEERRTRGGADWARSGMHQIPRLLWAWYAYTEQCGLASAILLAQSVLIWVSWLLGLIPGQGDKGPITPKIPPVTRNSLWNAVQPLPAVVHCCAGS